MLRGRKAINAPAPRQRPLPIAELQQAHNLPPMVVEFLQDYEKKSWPYLPLSSQNALDIASFGCLLDFSAQTAKQPSNHRLTKKIAGDVDVNLLLASVAQHYYGRNKLRKNSNFQSVLKNGSHVLDKMHQDGYPALWQSGDASSTPDKSTVVSTPMNQVTGMAPNNLISPTTTAWPLQQASPLTATSAIPQNLFSSVAATQQPSGMPPWVPLIQELFFQSTGTVTPSITSVTSPNLISSMATTQQPLSPFALPPTPVKRHGVTDDTIDTPTKKRRSKSSTKLARDSKEKANLSHQQQLPQTLEEALTRNQQMPTTRQEASDRNEMRVKEFTKAAMEYHSGALLYEKVAAETHQQMATKLFADMEQRMAAHQQQMLATYQQVYTNLSAEMERKMEAQLQKMLAACQQISSQWCTNFEALATNMIQMHGDQINQVKHDIGELGDQVDDSIGELGDQVDDSIDEVKASIDEVKASVNHVRDIVEECFDSNRDMGADITQISADITQISADITQISADITQIRADIA